MILGMGVPELAVILVIVLVIFGPKNLPKIGSAIGKTVKNVREGMEEGSGDSGPSSEPSVSPIEASDAEKDDDLRERICRLTPRPRDLLPARGRPHAGTSCRRDPARRVRGRRRPVRPSLPRCCP